MLKVNIKHSIPNRYEALNYEFELSIATASTTGIFGISGAGKSTLLRLITGLETPQSGIISNNDIIWFSHNQSSKKPTENLSPQQRQLSLMLPSKQLFPNMSVEQNIDYANNSGLSAKKWLDKFDLTHLSQRHPTYLSQGEQQRIAFIRALANKPQLLLLDEPFSAINEELKPIYYKALKDYQKKWDMSIIIVSHNRVELNQLAQQQYELKNGSLIVVAI